MRIFSKFLVLATMCATAQAALADVATAPVLLPEMRFENKSGGSTLLYGHLNPAYLSFDDGVSQTNEIVDSTHSQSRVGVWVRQPYGANEFTFNFETSLGLRQSAAVSQTYLPDAIKWKRVNIRKIDFSLNTESFGRFSAGQGSMATDGAAQSDQSGTTLVLYSSVPDTAGAFRFRRSDGTLSTRLIVGSFGDFDGGRLGRIRYDTPRVGGFTLSASFGRQVLIKNSDLETAAIALRYSGEFGGIRIRGALGYARKETGPAGKFKDTIGSLSMLHPSGFNLTLAAGRRAGLGPTGTYGYGKVGYLASWFAVGRTALAVDYYRGNDRSVAGARSTAVGFGAVQTFDRLNVQAYLGLRNYELSEPTQSYRDASSVLFGARWKF